MLFQFSLFSATEAMLVPSDTKEKLLLIQSTTHSIFDTTTFTDNTDLLPQEKSEEWHWNHPPPAIPALCYPAFLRQGTMTANSLLKHGGQTGTALGDVPSGTFPIWCHLEQLDFQPLAGQCSKEAKVEETGRQKKMPQREELSGVQVMCKFSSQRVALH